MKRVKSIGGVVLDNNCFISTEFDVDNYIGESSIAIDGSSIVFIQPKGAMTLSVEIYSKDSGWVLEDTKNALIAIVDELSKVVVFDDDSSDVYYFDHTKVPISFTPLYNGSFWYNVLINLIKG